jgi:CHASE2 domain-containing sensor protein
MKFFSIVLIVLSLSAARCKLPSVNLTDQLDPDIVLVNIEDGDRAFLADLLMKIDSCKPALIAIDVYFYGEKGQEEDSLLMQALRKIENDLLIYSYDKEGKRKSSHSKFNSFASDLGLMKFEESDGIVTNMIPIRVVKNITHESLSLRIVKKWKPDFQYKFRDNRSMAINYRRTLDQYTVLHSSDISNLDSGFLSKKMVIVGYGGPGKEDKHYTPIRIIKEYPDGEPDTYGIVIVANEIRTLLDLEIKEKD